MNKSFNRTVWVLHAPSNLPHWQWVKLPPTTTSTFTTQQITPTAQHSPRPSVRALPTQRTHTTALTVHIYVVVAPTTLCHPAQQQQQQQFCRDSLVRLDLERNSADRLCRDFCVRSKTVCDLDVECPRRVSQGHFGSGFGRIFRWFSEDYVKV